ncbi:MAG: AAA-like domain-containing protein [Desulfobacterales bacterium]|nr:AAA-like domain-containing protein [Desulfobacterales bacterium]MBF0396783.1 AAA-like domain-containing protein [Desulfobacterales bacterium]
MRKFYSYGPINSNHHFFVDRKEIVQKCTEQLIGYSSEGGHYFTIWAPRQTGKTWLMREIIKNIEFNYSEQFAILNFSFGVFRGHNINESDELEEIPLYFSQLIEEKFPKNPIMKNWKDFRELFSKTKGCWDRPLLLFIDEVDTLPSPLLDVLVGQFRELYLDQKNNFLHGLSLIGVKAILGVDSHRGSPFNIQRSLQVPNLTKEEVQNLFKQYQDESGQKIDPEVVNSVYDSTRGQPGLVSWFGELLTEKYNADHAKVIDLDSWKLVYMRSLSIEWNNNVLNLIKKAKGKYQDYVMELFISPDIDFSIDSEWCIYLYLNGIIDSKIETIENDKEKVICIFSSPFIQHRLYNAFTHDIIGERLSIPALETLDDLSDVFENDDLNLYMLLQRYKNFLKRLKAKGINPWKDQPRRADFHLTEAVGHFHLYAWLQNAIGKKCSISPEFPTGNGRVDLHIKCREKRGIIEVKSFTNITEAKEDKIKASKYARQIGLKSITMAVFVPVEDENILAKISGEEMIDYINVKVAAIGWV